MLPKVLPSWAEHAACVGSDLHYPEKGEAHKAAKAKRVCREECRVLEECLAWAIANRELHGIWGATTTRERYALGMRASGEDVS